MATGLADIVQKESNGEVELDEKEYVNRLTSLAIQCSFLAGLIQISMGALRLGFVTQFLSRALISGFTSAAAVIISLSQLKHFLGVDIPTSKRSYQLVQHLIQKADEWNGKAFAMGMSCLGVLLLLKQLSQNEKWTQKYPSVKGLKALGPFLVTVVAITLTVTLDLDTKGIRVVGTIPPGLPQVTVDQWTPLSSRLWVSDHMCVNELV